MNNDYFKKSDYLVLNFHPVHLFVNAISYKSYRELKKKYGDINKWKESQIRKYINNRQKGVFNFFKELVFSKNITFHKISYSKNFLK